MARQRHTKEAIPKAIQGRLCNVVANPLYSKNLFRDLNRAILRSTEAIFGGELTPDSNLPHLICRPCERRLNNFSQFKSITEMLRLLQQDVRSKRCSELSPSVAKPLAKVCAARVEEVLTSVKSEMNLKAYLLVSYICCVLYYLE